MTFEALLHEIYKGYHQSSDSSDKDCWVEWWFQLETPEQE